jgi:2-polyprenyl-3-methyl-5-hydroxy-6-metoxy-1,4-benzoquinol methylase
MNKSKNLLEKIKEKNPKNHKSAHDVYMRLGADECERLEKYLNYQEECGRSDEMLLECYEMITKEAVLEGIYFRRHKTYRYSKYEEVAEKVYNDNEYMTKYMIGLALTGFLWPNHVMINRFFDALLPKLSHNGGDLLEVGPGHGAYLQKTYSSERFNNIHVIDLSKTSLELSKKLLGRIRVNSTQVEYFHQDFLRLRDNSKKYEAIIIGEVIEHVENPLEFIKKAEELLSPGGILFLTTCLNAPAIDHLYNWESIVHLESQLTSGNFIVEDRLLLGTKGAAISVCEANKFPINVAYTLRAK